MGHFLPFYPSNIPKTQKMEKIKKILEISSFYICVPKTMIRWCMVPEIWCTIDVIVISHFALFFALYPPLAAVKNQYFEKITKAPGDIIILHTCTKIMIRWCTVPEIWFATDGRTDGWKKWHVEVGAPPKKWYKKEAPLK